MTESLCRENKFYNRVCQMILFSLYLNKHIKLKELRNTVDGILRLQSKSPLDDDTWRACMKILNDTPCEKLGQWPIRLDDFDAEFVQQLFKPHLEDPLQTRLVLCLHFLRT